MIRELTISSNINYHPSTSLGLKPSHWGFPCSLAVKSSPTNTGDTGSISGQGRSHLSLMEQLSQCATTTEPLSCNYRSPHAPEPMLHNKRCHNERPAHHTKEQPGSTQCNYRKAQAATETQHSPKSINLKKKQKKQKKQVHLITQFLSLGPQVLRNLS